MPNTSYYGEYSLFHRIELLLSKQFYYNNQMDFVLNKYEQKPLK